MREPEDRRTCREKLRQLDGFLHVLEDDHLRGEVAVSSPVAELLRPHVAAVTVGMSIAEAIELVFTEQEPYLGSPDEDAPARAGGDARPGMGTLRVARELVSPLSEEGARALTERIRNATQHVCMLLMEAHQRRAWSALGYRTWERYVKCEFGLSRSRSYELLDQGRVIAELQVAAGMSEIPDISAYVAGQIKPCLGDVTRIIRDRVRGVPDERVRDIIGEVVQQQRTRARALRDARRGRQVPAGLTLQAAGVGDLHTAINCLATMPDPVDTAGRMQPEAAGRLSLAESALHWLGQFVAELKRRTQADALRHLIEDGESEELAVGA